MRLISTQGQAGESDFAQAVFSGLADDGGLWVPDPVPQIDSGDITALAGMDWPELSTWLARFLLSDEVPGPTLDSLVRDALDFEIPLHALEDGIFVLELFHGPTLAFKDVAARFLARIMGHFSKHEDQELTVLVATSGDTGSAVAQAFFRVPGVSVKVLYPKGQVSEAQRKLFTTLGHNVEAVEVSGSFDDCQRMVKTAFSNQELRRRRPLASANSINIGRLLPQSFYYFWAWAQLRQLIGAAADRVRFAVPSGNFGNLTAGLLARRMGLPCGRFVASTNRNDVVPRYLTSGRYDPVGSVSTISNAMDVGDPSNFDRIRFLYDGSPDAVRADIEGSSWSDDQTRSAMHEIYRATGTVLDPHTAVGYLGLREARRTAHDDRGPHDPGPNDPGPGVILATAHPAKFQEVVEDAIQETIELPSALADSLVLDEAFVSMEADPETLVSYLRDGASQDLQ